ncbi:MAG: chorismate mutase [Ruminococcaceae bacterium]|nr:chorismate mutase [Oscillospiraceae bacterium]
MSDLEQARQAINEADRELVRLFERRMEAVRQVAQYKKEHGLPVEDTTREEHIVRKNAAFVENEDYRSYYVSFLRAAMELSKNYQHRLLDGMRVAYSGVEGAFANIVAKRIFPDATAVSHGDFAEAYQAVVDGDCDCALLPVENSHNGDVGKVLDLAFFGNLYVTGVYEAEIVQNLLAVPGTTLEDVKTVISHPQALGQCAAYIKHYGFNTVEAVNTAVAVRQVAEIGRKDIAAIGSVEAGEQFGLTKLEGHINESGQNTTRFAVFSRARRSPSPKDTRFILLFTVNNSAGSLGRAVSVIGEHGFNLRALKSRPTKELVWDYYFYAEGEGDLTSENGQEMIRKLKECCSNVKILGSYEKETHI